MTTNLLTVAARIAVSSHVETGKGWLVDGSCSGPADFGIFGSFGASFPRQYLVDMHEVGISLA